MRVFVIMNESFVDNRRCNAEPAIVCGFEFTGNQRLESIYLSQGFGDFGYRCFGVQLCHEDRIRKMSTGCLW